MLAGRPCENDISRYNFPPIDISERMLKMRQVVPIAVSQILYRPTQKISQHFSVFFLQNTKVNDEKFRHFTYSEATTILGKAEIPHQTSRSDSQTSPYFIRNLKFGFFKSDTYCQKRVLFIMQQTEKEEEEL